MSSLSPAAIIFDETGTYATAVKPPSTPAVAADQAVVVTVSPNNSVVIEGPVAAGGAAIENPVAVAGVDSAGLLRNLHTDGYGNLIVVASTVSPNVSTGIVTGTIQLGSPTQGRVSAIYATAYNEPSTNGQRSMRSSSINDSATSAGARVIRVTYFDNAGAGPFIENVTLSGTTWINTANTNICYVEKMEAVTVGSVRTNIGTITLNSGTAGAGTAIGTIGVGKLIAGRGDGRTLWAHHYVPAGKTAKLATYIISAESGGSQTNGTFFLKAQALPVGNNAELIVSDILLTTGPLVRQLAIPIRIVGPTRVTAYGVPAVNNAKLNASFDFSEE